MNIDTKILNQLKAISNIMDLIKHPRELTDNDYEIQHAANPNLSKKEIRKNLFNVSSIGTREKIEQMIKGNYLSTDILEKDVPSAKDLEVMKKHNVIKVKAKTVEHLKNHNILKNGIKNIESVVKSIGNTVSAASNDVSKLVTSAKNITTNFVDAVVKSANTTKNGLAKIVNRFLGIPYKFGGKTLDAIDCSGFVKKVYNAMGIKMPDGTSLQCKVGKVVARGKVDISKLKYGDCIFFAMKGKGISHVGIYMGNGKMAHASFHKGTVVTTLSPYFTSKIVQVNRIVSEEELNKCISNANMNDLSQIKAAIKSKAKTKNTTKTIKNSKKNTNDKTKVVCDNRTTKQNLVRSKKENKVVANTRSDIKITTI